jgi:hypothetical protein
LLLARRVHAPERRRGVHGYLQPTQQGSQASRGFVECSEALNFLVIQRTIVTRAQSVRSVKDIQSHLRHSRAENIANEYMQEMPESVQQMVETVFAMPIGERSKMAN